LHKIRDTTHSCRLKANLISGLISHKDKHPLAGVS
jgi:hypothetical protein